MQTYHIYYLMPEEKKSVGTGTIKKINKEEYKKANKNVNKKENDKECKKESRKVSGDISKKRNRKEAEKAVIYAKEKDGTDASEEISCRIGEYTITAVTLDVSSLALETSHDENPKREDGHLGEENRQAEKSPDGNKEGKVRQPDGVVRCRKKSSDGIVRRQKKLSGGNSSRQKKLCSEKNIWFKKLLGRSFRLIVKLFAGNRVREKMFRHFHLYDSVKGKEIVVVSEKLQKILPRHMWYDNMTEDFPKGLHEAFAVESLADIINHTGVANDTGAANQKDSADAQPQYQTIFNLAVILPQGGVTQELLEEILSCAGEMNELIFYSFDEDEKEWLEDKLDDFLEETGVAGMCYQMMDDRWENPLQKSRELGKVEESMILMDFTGRPIKELWGISYYIDAVGRRTKKEIRRLAGRKTHVKALRCYLDSALSLRYNNLA